jgi:hypothetical protein
MTNSLTRGTWLLVFLAPLVYLAPCPSAAQSYETIYSFEGSPDGANPRGGLVIAANGALFGTTFAGGTSGSGTVYELTYAKGTGWKETVLHNFGGSPDGANPESTLAFGSTGALYGTTRMGGAGFGALFEMAPPTTSGSPWTETVLGSFGIGQNALPNGTGLIDKSGTLYATAQGTLFDEGNPLGSVIALVPPATQGGARTQYELYDFGLDLGEGPRAGVVSVGGSLCGTTYFGNTIYELAPPTIQGGAWTETTLYTFAGPPSDGHWPLGALTVGPGGVLYGTTSIGGTGSCPHAYVQDGCGTVFQFTPPATPGGAWTESVIYSFTGANGDGAYPEASVVIGKDGALYGTTTYGGIYAAACPDDYDFPGGCGMVFKLTPPSAPGGAWTETVLHDFTHPNGDGIHPVGPLVLSSTGVLYGTTYAGGTTGEGANAGEGTVFAIEP